MRHGALAATLLIACAIGLVQACSIALDASIQQCSTDGDCTAKGAGFSGTRCSSDGRCVTSCLSNAQCNGAGSAPSICRAVDQRCVALTSAMCPSVMADASDLQSDETVYVGLIVPLTGVDSSAGLKNKNGVDLARGDIRKGNGGLPPIAGGKTRPFAIVACDEALDLDAAARHLVQDLHVPAIIGPAFSGDLLQVAGDVTIGADVLVVSGSATSPLITDRSPIVWSTAASDAVQVLAVAGLIANLEVVLRPTGTPPLKVAVVTKNDAYGSSFATLFGPNIVFNKLKATDNGDNYKPVVYDAKLIGGDALATDAVTSAAPDIVVLVGTNEAVGDVLVPVEKKWPSGKTRPRWILTDGLVVKELFDVVAADSDLRSRVVGTAYGDPNRTQFHALSDEYRGVFLADHTGLDPATAGFYDATFLVYYAIAANGGNAPSGTALAKAIRASLLGPGGPSINVGSGDLSRALKSLPTPGINLAGAAGDLAYAPSEQTSMGNFDIWCVGVDPTGGGRELNTGLIYDAQKRAITGGVLRCP